MTRLHLTFLKNFTLVVAMFSFFIDTAHSQDKPGGSGHAGKGKELIEKAREGEARTTTSTLFPLKFFKNLYRVEEDGSVAAGKGFDNLFIKSSGFVKVGGKTYALGTLYGDDQRPFKNNKYYLIEQSEFDAVKKEKGWKQALPPNLLQAADLKKILPNVNIDEFQNKAISLKGKNIPVYSSTGLAKGTEDLKFIPAQKTKSGNYVVGTLHSVDGHGNVNPKPAYPKQYAVPSSSMDGMSHEFYNRPLPEGLLPFDESKIQHDFGTQSPNMKKLIKCAKDRATSHRTVGYCATGVKHAIQCAYNIPYQGGIDAWLMGPYLEKKGFTKVNVASPDKTPVGCINVYDSYARELVDSKGRSTYLSFKKSSGWKSAVTKYGKTISGFPPPKPKKGEKWHRYWGHIEVVTAKGQATSDHIQGSGISLKNGKTVGYKGNNRYYKFKGAYCKK